MANKAWLDATRAHPPPPPVDTPTSNGKFHGLVSTTMSAGWGKQAFVNRDSTTIRAREEQVSLRAVKVDTPGSSSIPARRELPPHLQNSPSFPKPAEKPATNGWSKIGATSAPPANGSVNGRVTGFKPIPTGPRLSTAGPPRTPSIDLASRTRPTPDRRLETNGVTAGTRKDGMDGSNHVRGSDSGTHIPEGNGSSLPPPLPRSGMSVFDDFEFRVNASTSRGSSARKLTNEAPPPPLSPPPPPQEEELPSPPSPPRAITSAQTARLLKSPEERSKITIGLGMHREDEEMGSRRKSVQAEANGNDVSPSSQQQVSAQASEPPATPMTDLYPWIPPSPRTIRSHPPDLTRHIPGRGNFKTCDPALHHPANGKEEKMNTGCGRAFKHEKPITRYDGSWQGKEVDVLEVKDPRLEMDPAVREKGMGSKKNAYKGLYQIEPYEWDENSPFPKPPPPPEGICISNINPLITLGQIEAAVTAIGKTKNIDMKLDPRTGMQMGICHITFHPSEERRPGDGKKIPSTLVEIPAWQIAKAAKQRLNGRSIGMNVGGQRESIMKVVLDANGDRAKRAVEVELEKRRRGSTSTNTAVPPVAATPVQTMAQSAAAWTANPPAAVQSSTPMPPPTMIPPSRVQSNRNPEPSPKTTAQPLPSLPNRSTAYDGRGPSRGNERANATGFGYGTPGHGNSNGRTYRDSLASSKSFEIGRLPPPSTASYSSSRMGSSYTPTSNTLGTFSTVSSFVAAPFAHSRVRDARMPPSRGRVEDGRRGPTSYNEPPFKPMDRHQPPSALESYHRRSSRSRRSSSVSRTESDVSESDESSEGGRTPSPVRMRGTRRRSERDPDQHQRARRSEDRGDARPAEVNEADQLVAKVREELRENGRAYIFIDHKSLPIPQKVSDRERMLVDLRDHLKAVKLEKVTYNLHGWYILFPDDTTAKKTQMVFDRKVMSGRPLTLAVKEALAKPVDTTPANTMIGSPAKSLRTPRSEPGSAKKLDTQPLYSEGLPGMDTDEIKAGAEPSPTKDLRTPVSRGTKKQKISRVISSDDEDVAQVDEKTISMESTKSADSVDKDLDVAPEAVDDGLVNGKEDSVTVTSMDIVDSNADIQLEDVEPFAPSRKKKAPAKSKRKSEAVGKPAKQPAKKKQKKAVASVAVEDAEPHLSPMEVEEPQQEPLLEPLLESAPQPKFKKVAVADSAPEVSLLDLIKNGIAADDEDLYYLRLAAEHSLNGTVPDLPVAAEDDEDEEANSLKPHPSGCARAHGYYKVPEVEKSAYLPQRNRAVAEVEAAATNATAIATSRSTRVNSRRLVQGMEQHKKGNASATDTDLFQFNQLRTRKKQLKFSKSPIHDWGLYAMEHITQGEMVIEYVGEVIRAQVADIREKWYEKTGIGSSYLFRVDDDAVVDATKKGNLGRLINHCCYPNCTAKIITINGEKKIVIYAKSNIEPGEEITYDYHFPIEQEKIPCLCGSDKCRGYLN